MSNHAYRAASAPGVVQRARNTKTGRRLERGGYLTVETVTMWIVYALTLVGNAVIEGGQVGGNTSATVAYGVFTWFTPAGYVFAIWSVIYVALIVWLVAYTRNAATRRRRSPPPRRCSSRAACSTCCGWRCGISRPWAYRSS